MKTLGSIAVLLLACLAGPAPTRAETVTVFAAASLKTALDEVVQTYEARTGDEVRLSYAASSTIARQIEQGAPADLFISADQDWMNYLQTRGLIAPGSRRDLLTNRLVLIAPASSKTPLRIRRGMPLAAALGEGRLAMAGPDVPAGRYAKAALTALGVWPTVSGKLAQAENVRVALQFVALGEAPLGVVYDTDALAEPRVRVVGVFPESTHPRIVYPAALTMQGRGRRASALLTFMSGPEAARIFRRNGFSSLARR